MSNKLKLYSISVNILDMYVVATSEEDAKNIAFANLVEEASETSALIIDYQVVDIGDVSKNYIGYIPYGSELTIGEFLSGSKSDAEYATYLMLKEKFGDK